DEDQAVPLHHRQLTQAPLSRVESGPVLEAGGRLEVAVEAERRGVVRADDDALTGGSAARQQLVAAMPAGVGEGVQPAVFVPGQEHAAGAGSFGALVAGPRHLLTAADAEPAAAEEVLLLPREHGRIGVCGPRQHPALAEWEKGL